MASELFDLAASISRAQAPAPEPESLTAGRNLAAEYAGMDPAYLASIAWSRGFTRGFKDGLDAAEQALDRALTKPAKEQATYDNSAACQRCGRKVRMISSSPLTAADLARVVCMNCCSEERTS